MHLWAALGRKSRSLDAENQRDVRTRVNRWPSSGHHRLPPAQSPEEVRERERVRGWCKEPHRQQCCGLYEPRCCSRRPSFVRVPQSSYWILAEARYLHFHSFLAQSFEPGSASLPSPLLSSVLAYPPDDHHSLQLIFITLEDAPSIALTRLPRRQY